MNECLYTSCRLTMPSFICRANKGRWEKVGAPPHGITPTKGSVHVVVNRDFVDYVLHNSIAQDFLNWTKRIDVPDEAFFSTLNHNPQLGIRGTYNGLCSEKHRSRLRWVRPEDRQRTIMLDSSYT